MIHKIISKIKENKKEATQMSRATYHEIGFHGDLFLIELIYDCLRIATVFIETGTNVGSTLNYVAENFPQLMIYSCEPEKEAYDFIAAKLEYAKNVCVKNQPSPLFLYNLIAQDRTLVLENTLFWLDAHGYGYQWPLKDEIHFITHNFEKAFIFIDDFKVPGLDCFGYDQYDGQECSFDYIKDSINPNIKYHLYYPCYQERTSQHHPLRGWSLIEFGQDRPVRIPPNLSNKIKKII
jgi:hypothetical protein